MSPDGLHNRLCLTSLGLQCYHLAKLDPKRPQKAKVHWLCTCCATVSKQPHCGTALTASPSIIYEEHII